MSKARTDDAAFMRRALQLASRGRGRVEPNPMVGCVIVRGGRIIGEGHHRRFGGPHAEIEALRRCGGRAEGTTVYVTLEPCCYHGKTPPCTEALIAAGVRRVVAAMRDPNPRVAGRGLRLLRRAGIEATVGECAEAAAELNAPFVKLMRERRPWVILKWAQSVDGKIATRTGDSKWITDEVMRGHAHRVRGRMDAIIVGSQTARTDDPMLTCRAGRAPRVATRVVVDTKLRTPVTAQLVRTAREVPTLLFCGDRAPEARLCRLEAAGCAVERVSESGRSGLALTEVLDRLGERQMTNVLVEGGGALLGDFFDQGLADEVHVYIAPRLIGGRQAIGALHGRGVARVQEGALLPPDGKLKTLGTGWLLQNRLSRKRTVR